MSIFERKPSATVSEHPGLPPDAPFEGTELMWEDTAALASEHAGEASLGDTSVDAAVVQTRERLAVSSEKKGGLSARFSELLRPIQKFFSVSAVSAQVAVDATSARLHPEINWVAGLRRENTLSQPEAAFLPLRLGRLTGSRRNGGILATFMQLEDEDEEVVLEDVPIIGLGGSGGGMRACLGYAAVCEQVKGLGMWDLITYFSGVSGSCWAIGSYYTWGVQDFGKVLDHFEKTANHHPLSQTAVRKVADSKGGVYQQWAPILMKAKSGVRITLLDLYGTFVTSYMWLPPSQEAAKQSTKGRSDEPDLKREWFHWSRTWKLVEHGGEPLPILTAVRHERPWKDWKDPTEPFADTDNAASSEHREAQSAWWQWFEFTPVEIGCDELEGWVPTWAFGRQYSAGESTQNLPEQSLSLMLGLATSAPAGPLSSYLGTIYRNLPNNIFGDVIKFLSDGIAKEWGPDETEKFEDHHPVHACNEPNPFFHAVKEEGRGQGIENSPRVHLIDAGMSNNCPTHVFCHPARAVDIVINFDASSDVQKGAALERIDDFGKEVGVKFTPREQLAPLSDLPKDKDGKPVQLSAEETAARFKGRYAQVLDGAPVGPQCDFDQGVLPDGWKIKHLAPGSKQTAIYNERHQPQMTRGFKMAYVPLIPHACQPEYDPSTAKFSSSYNLVWTPEQVRTIRKTAGADFAEGLETIRKLVREVYEEKKAKRLGKVSTW